MSVLQRYFKGLADVAANEVDKEHAEMLLQVISHAGLLCGGFTTFWGTYGSNCEACSSLGVWEQRYLQATRITPDGC